MLVTSSKLIGTPILSMQASGSIGTISSLVVDPESLKIVAFIITGPLADKRANVLDVKSIREYSSFGMVIDSIDELVQKEDILKISDIIDLNFNLIDLKVESKKGSKLGHVSDFTVTSEDFTLQQIIVRRPLFKSLTDSELTIPRKEIVEVTDYKIIVKDEEKTIRKKAENEDFIPNFVNPFRKTEQVHAPARTKTPVDTDTE